MKTRMGLLLTVFLATIFLVACNSDDIDLDETNLNQVEYASYYNNYHPDYIEKDEIDEFGENEDEYISPPGLWDYTFIWPQGRDREWEEDLIYFAQTFLFVHPIMRNVQIPITDTQSILLYANISDDTDIFHNSELRARFLDEIHELIGIIPELEDYEIIFSLSEIAALLDDAHTGFMLGPTTFRNLNQHYYPFFFTYFSNGFFVERVLVSPDISTSYEHALYSRLLSINDISVDEIIRLFSNVIPHENEYYIPTYISLHNLMRHSEFLVYLGITTGDETVFTFEDSKGDIISITTSPYGGLDNETISSTIDREAFIAYSRPDWQWYEFFGEYDMMYVRLHNFFGTGASSPFEEFYLGLATETRRLLEDGEIDSFVLDLRGNRGGFLDYFGILFDLIYTERNRINSVYILIDSFTYSNGVVAGAILRENIEDVLILGEPTGQSPNFFAAPSTHWLPNSNIQFSVSRVFFNILPECQQNALYPDIHVPFGFEDFMNSHDPVMEMIIAKE